MAFPIALDMFTIDSAAAMSRALQILLLASLDPMGAALRADSDPGDEDRDGAIDLGDTAFIVLDTAGSGGWRVTITDDQGPAPVQIGEHRRRLFALADKLGPGVAIAWLEKFGELSGPEGTAEPEGDDDAPTADEGEMIAAARRLGISPAAAISRLIEGEPSSLDDIAAEKLLTMEQAGERFASFLVIHEQGADGDGRAEAAPDDSDDGRGEVEPSGDRERDLLEIARRYGVNKAFNLVDVAVRRGIEPVLVVRRECTGEILAECPIGEPAGD